MDQFEKDLFRFMINVHVCLYDVAKKVYLEINDGQAPEYDLFESVNKINSVIKKYDMEIIRGRSDVSGVEHLALICVSKSTINEKAKFFDKKTKLFFSKIIERCVLSDGCISDITCGNVSLQAEMSKTAAQAAMADLVSKKWLEIDAGSVYLGVRSITELGQILLQSFPEQVKSCSLCRNTVCYGTKCSSCGEKGHNYCLTKFWERQHICPHCKKNWPQSSSAVSDSDGESGEASPITPKQQKRSRRVIVEDDDDDEDE